MFHLLTILMFFNLVSGSCCHKIKASFAVQNNAYGQNSDRFGYYTMQAGFVNGKAHFLKDAGKARAIWYSSASETWIVGTKSNLGKSNGKLFVVSKAACPYTPGYTWRYEQYGSWRDADEGFSIFIDVNVNLTCKILS